MEAIEEEYHHPISQVEAVIPVAVGRIEELQSLLDIMNDEMERVQDKKETIDEMV